MKKFFVCFYLLASSIIFCQEQFVFTDQGLNPTTISAEFQNMSVYSKSLKWIKDNSETHKIKVLDSLENEMILFTASKGNAVSLDKQYFNVRYTIRLNFKESHYTFEPTEIDLKLNSKYDMGWKPFNFKDTSQYFKKGKPIKKYRAYLNGISQPLNLLHQQWVNFIWR